MTRSYVAKITGKGQLTIPKASRDALNLRDGEYVLLYPQGEGVRMERADVSPVERFETLAVRTGERFAGQGVKPRDVEEAIRWARESAELSSTPTS